MLRLKRFSSAVFLNSKNVFSREEKLVSPIHLSNPCRLTSSRFLDIYQGSKDEMNRGYFADINELKQHGGKIATANKIIIPAVAAVKFPALEVNHSDGSSLKLPIASIGNGVAVNKAEAPKASLLCLSFRASSQAMVDSWSKPFLDTFKDSNRVQLYEISFIDSWLLTLSPVKKLLLRTMRKSNPDESKDVLHRQIVYSFGDHYYFRKELKILNLLTGYTFLLDKFGRIRWQGSGLATEEELSSLLSCTSLLLDEE
ncbi:uncharacterized protein LOC107825726 isoform X2 [Nicotiana tabacum]|uniref:Uncharacterized protein LOC107825726 isoform X2 n=1 Tax=Nicotiana tabacum TaxID=4097 RepID=A0A1S4D3X3_TOBAC|nr:PREDICTED: uncharacterized protein LOC107825726 isoform X2 [Nicotiana tabacum]